jgi:arginine deiminase
MPFHVSSETGRLRQVIMHRPGTEFGRPATDPARRWLRAAQIQHDVMAEVLGDHGVTVHYFSDLLVDVLDRARARSWIVDRVLHDGLGPDVCAAVRQIWAGSASRPLAESLVAGIRTRDLPVPSAGGPGRGTSAAAEHVFAPLTNQAFQRHHSVLVYGGVCVSTGGSRAGAREYLYEAVYRFHPMFADQGVPVWFGSDAERRPAALDGSDVQVLGRGRVLAALGGRSTTEGVRRLARNLFLDGGASRLLVVELTGAAARDGLDASVSLVDRETVLLGAHTDRRMRSWTVRPAPWADDPDDLEIVANDDFLTALRDMLGVDRLTTVTAAGADRSTAPFLVVEPGVVISDDANHGVNAGLRRRGVEVATVACSDFGPRRGGPRGVTCVIERDAA